MGYRQSAIKLTLARNPRQLRAHFSKTESRKLIAESQTLLK